jgi:hypothetical protein
MKEQSSGKKSTDKSTVDLMRLYVDRLPYDVIFTSRDLLPFASRNSVDQFTSKSVKNGYLERLTRGAFRKLHPDIELPRPSEAEIHFVKRQAFAGKLVAKDKPSDFLCRQCSHKPETTKKASLLDKQYFGDGHSSSLELTQHNKRANRKGMAPRKLALCDTTLALALRDLWLLGRKLCTIDKVQCMLSRFTYRDLIPLTRYRKLIPQWLGEMIPFYPTSELVKMIPQPCPSRRY